MPRFLPLRIRPALALAALLCPACSRVQHPDILLVVVDTLRVDRLGCYGNPRGLTPELDDLSSQAARFLQARAHAPWTLPSMATILTSELPLEHGAGGSLTPELRSDFHALAPSARTLAEVLHDAGYATAAITNVTFLTEPFGLLQGFEHQDAVAFESNVQVRDARATTDAALRWLERTRDRPAFLFVHYFDAHAVYDPPPDLRERFGPERPQDWTFGTRAQMAALRRGALELDPATVRDAEALYDGEVASIDRELGRLLDAVGPETIVSVTADHGEEFLDHGGFEHGHTLYDELLHVPWLLRAPGVVPHTVRAEVGLIDLAPTLCELAGVPPAPSFRGHGLARLLRIAMEPVPEPHLAHGNMWGPALTSWTSSGWKLIRGPAGAELYDLILDPKEQHDLSADPSADPQRDRLEEELAAVLAALDLRRGQHLELDARTRARLGELGYLGAGDLEDEP